ncbi:MAG: OadG family protein [Lachnospiraceae bacterium]|nr:OadG family protein [Lachnospiraceae bacterium]
MKKLKKAALLLLTVMMMAAVLSGCGSKTSSQIEAEKQIEIRSENLNDVKAYTESIAQFLGTQSFEKFRKLIASGKNIGNAVFTNNLENRWTQFYESHGEITAVSVLDAEREEEGFSDRLILTGEDGEQMLLTLHFNSTMTPVTAAIQEYSDDSTETLGSKMAAAGVNTLTGLLVVFFVLVGLSLIISCFRFIGKGGEVAPQKKDAPKKAAAPAAAPAPAVSSAEVDLAKEQELVAVIAAAIAAAEDRPVDGYTVRSIRRLRSNKWS